MLAKPQNSISNVDADLASKYADIFTEDRDKIRKMTKAIFGVELDLAVGFEVETYFLKKSTGEVFPATNFINEFSKSSKIISAIDADEPLMTGGNRKTDDNYFAKQYEVKSVISNAFRLAKVGKTMPKYLEKIIKKYFFDGAELTSNPIEGEYDLASGIHVHASFRDKDGNNYSDAEFGDSDKSKSGEMSKLGLVFTDITLDYDGKGGAIIANPSDSDYDRLKTIVAPTDISLRNELRDYDNGSAMIKGGKYVISCAGKGRAAKQPSGTVRTEHRLGGTGAFFQSAESAYIFMRSYAQKAIMTLERISDDKNWKDITEKKIYNKRYELPENRQEALEQFQQSKLMTKAWGAEGKEYVMQSIVNPKRDIGRSIRIDRIGGNQDTIYR